MIRPLAISLGGFLHGWGLCLFLAIVVFFLWQEHRAHLLGAVPYVLLLLCPVIHVFMHRGHATAHEWYSEFLSWMGQHDKAIRAARRALDLDQVSLRANSHVGLALYRARNYEAAIERFRETLHLDRDYADAHVMLGVTLVQTRKYDEAIAEFQRARVLTANSPELLGLLGYAYGMAGMKREAQDVLKELDRLSRQNRYVSSFSRVTIHIGLGEIDLAFKWLERAYEERLWYLGLLAVDPLFDPLQEDPRYTDLLRRMNLTRAES